MGKTNWSQRLAIHILTRQRHPYLACLLNSLLEQTHVNWDLFILDNNDEPYMVNNDHLVMSILKRIQNHKHNVFVIRPKDEGTKKNIGISRNILIEASKKDYKWACRIDDDSILDRNYLKRLWTSCMFLTNMKTRVGAIGGVVPSYAAVKLYKYPPQVFNKIEKTSVPEKWLQLSEKYKDESGFKGNEDYYRISEPVPDGVFYYHPNEPVLIPTHHIQSSFLFNMEAVIKVGGHSSKYFSTGFREESELSIKLINSRYNLYTHTQAICKHLWAPNLGRGQEPEQQERQILRQEHYFQTVFGGMLNYVAKQDYSKKKSYYDYEIVKEVV